MNEQLDSQLSAMFDDELPAAECELLARRLSKDEALKARWDRYALIGAAIRTERGARPAFAQRVTQAVGREPALSAGTAAAASRPAGQLRWQPAVGGFALAAGVAAGAILWMRAQAPLDPTEPALLSPLSASVAARSGQSPAHAQPALAATTASRVPTYVVPAPSMARRVVVPGTQLANYLVAHFEVSSPVAGQAMLSAFVAGDAGTTGTAGGSEDLVPVEDVQEDAKTTVE